jgi:uncharacterized membrane protein YgcG
MATKNAPTALDLDQLDAVTGGKGIAEIFHDSLGISESQGRILDAASLAFTAAIPGLGQLVGVAQGVADVGSTAMGWWNGTNSLTELGIASAGLAAAFVPGTGVFKAAGVGAEEIASLGKIAEAAGSQLIGVATVAAQTAANGLFGMSEEERAIAEHEAALHEAWTEHENELKANEMDHQENFAAEEKALHDAEVQHDAEQQQNAKDQEENFAAEEKALHDAEAQHEAEQQAQAGLDTSSSSGSSSSSSSSSSTPSSGDTFTPGGGDFGGGGSSGDFGGGGGGGGFGGGGGGE